MPGTNQFRDERLVGAVLLGDAKLTAPVKKAVENRDGWIFSGSSGLRCEVVILSGAKDLRCPKTGPDSSLRSE